MIVLIIILAALLRFTNLSHLPPGLYLDEILYGLDAYSIIKTGKDIYGHFLPLAFQSSGYYPPLFTYILASLFLFLPLVDWVVRLPAAISGIAAVIFIYLCTRKLLGQKNIALAAAAFLAFSLWHVHISRAAFLGSFGLVFPLVATYLFLSRKVVLSSILFAISTHAHYGYKFFSPLIFLILILLHRPKLKFIPLLLVTTITLFSHWLAITQFNALFRVDQIISLNLSNIIYQYLNAYSPNFLFLTGDHYRLLNPSPAGMLPLSLLPFLLAGFLALFKLPIRSRFLILAQLLLPPIPSALSGLGAHAVRNSPMLIPLMIIAAMGLSYWHHWSKYILITTLIIETIISFRFYALSYPLQSAHLWGQPERSLINKALSSRRPNPIPDTFNVRFSYYAFMTRLNPMIIQQVINQPIKSFNHIQFIDALRF